MDEFIPPLGFELPPREKWADEDGGQATAPESGIDFLRAHQIGLEARDLLILSRVKQVGLMAAVREETLEFSATKFSMVSGLPDLSLYSEIMRLENLSNRSQADERDLWLFKLEYARRLAAAGFEVGVKEPAPPPEEPKRPTGEVGLAEEAARLAEADPQSQGTVDDLLRTATVDGSTTAERDLAWAESGGADGMAAQAHEESPSFCDVGSGNDLIEAGEDDVEKEEDRVDLSFGSPGSSNEDVDEEPSLPRTERRIEYPVVPGEIRAGDIFILRGEEYKIVNVRPDGSFEIRKPGFLNLLIGGRVIIEPEKDNVVNLGGNVYSLASVKKESTAGRRWRGTTSDWPAKQAILPRVGLPGSRNYRRDPQREL